MKIVHVNSESSRPAATDLQMHLKGRATKTALWTT